MTKPNYHCPVCGALSMLIVSEVQACCTNTDGCQVVTFNPTLPDGGMSDVHVLEWKFNFEQRSEPHTVSEETGEPWCSCCNRPVSRCLKAEGIKE